MVSHYTPGRTIIWSNWSFYYATDVTTRYSLSSGKENLWNHQYPVWKYPRMSGYQLLNACSREHQILRQLAFRYEPQAVLGYQHSKTLVPNWRSLFNGESAIQTRKFGRTALVKASA
jgi:hypothetical protein